MSSKDDRFLLAAMEQSRLSVMKHQHGAVVVNHGKIVGTGYNFSRNHPRYMSKDHIKNGAAVHAEIAAIRLVSLASLNGATIYVARTNKRGMPMLSAPCCNCQQAIDQVGIKRVVFTTSNSLFDHDYFRSYFHG